VKLFSVPSIRITFAPALDKSTVEIASVLSSHLLSHSYTFLNTSAGATLQVTLTPFNISVTFFV